MTRRFWILVIVLAGLAAIAATMIPVEQDLPAAPASAVTAAAAPRLSLPPDQTALQAVVARYAAAYSQAPNEMAGGAQRPGRARALCRALPTTAFTNWYGTIDSLSSDSAGNGILTVRLADHLTIGTWNNDFSDADSHTLIPVDQPLFQVVAALKIGDPVRISGHFFADRSDCIREMSLSFDGGMKDPEFLAKFTQVQAAR